MFDRLKILAKKLAEKLTGPTAPPAPPGPVDPNAPPAPPPPPQAWWVKWVYRLVILLAWLATVYVANRLGLPAPPMPDIQQPAPALGFLPATGWVNDPEAVERVIREKAVPAFGDTPAGKSAMGEADAYLFRMVRKAGKFPDNRYPNINQRDVGYCVGCGTKHSCDVLLAHLALERGDEWKPTCAEAIYALSRVEIGGGKVRGDGSVGAWAVDAIGKYGVLPMEVVGGYDLRQTEPARARAWGRSGLPNDLEPIAKEHPVKGSARVNSWADVKRAIGQGYPVVVCSDQGFTMARDKDGFARPSGSWAHCMAIIGSRSQPREGGFILNSWGDDAHTGPVFPADAPVAGFWADASTIDRMVRQGDSFALSDAVGFPARQLPWFTRVEPARRRPFDADRPVFALAN